MPIKQNYDKSRRIYRGLFKSNTGILINSDVNGSYQIIVKAFPEAFVNGIEGAGLHPMQIKSHKWHMKMPMNQGFHRQNITIYSSEKQYQYYI